MVNAVMRALHSAQEDSLQQALERLFFLRLFGGFLGFVSQCA